MSQKQTNTIRSNTTINRATRRALELCWLSKNDFASFLARYELSGVWVISRSVVGGCKPATSREK